MSAYLQTLIQGNQNFGGYISVDGEKAFAVQHDMTYEITPGIHIITIYSTSNFERASGNVQKFAYNHSSSSGAVMDTLAKASAIKSLGDEWSIQIEISENEICEITNVSKGSKLIGDPMYRVRELSAEEVTMYEEKFEEWRNTPVRSKKKIKWHSK